MFVMFQIAALVLAADATPSYTVHIRELTVPEKVVRVPLDSSVAILDAVAGLKRSPRDLAEMDLWIARRAESGAVKVLRVDWAAITQRGQCATNYQILAGDRLFLQARPAKQKEKGVGAGKKGTSAGKKGEKRGYRALLIKQSTMSFFPSALSWLARNVGYASRRAL